MPGPHRKMVTQEENATVSEGGWGGGWCGRGGGEEIPGEAEGRGRPGLLLSRRPIGVPVRVVWGMVRCVRGPCPRETLRCRRKVDFVTSIKNPAAAALRCRGRVRRGQGVGGGGEGVG